MPINPTIESIFAGQDVLGVSDENANKNAKLLSTRRDLIAGEVSKEHCKATLPKEVKDAITKGILHVHDLDYSAMKGLINCSIPDFEALLKGTVINDIRISQPRSIGVATTVLTQLILVLSANQYGGLSVDDVTNLLAPYCEKSYRKHYEKLTNLELDEKDSERIAREYTRKDITDAIQTLNYQIQSFNANGQLPFISMIIHPPKTQWASILTEEILDQRMKGLPNKHGHPTTQLFPKLIYVLDETNATPDSPYWSLTMKSIQCSARRMYPDYISAPNMRKVYGGVYGAMGCRSFGVWDKVKGKLKARFNKGVQTANLYEIAKNYSYVQDFIDNLKEELEPVRMAGEWRMDNLIGTRATVSPTHWIYGGLAQLNETDVIDPLLFNGYSTMSLGYIGLAEALEHLTNKPYLTCKEEAEQVMRELYQIAQDWNALGYQGKHEHYHGTSYHWSVYGTPAESLTGKFAKLSHAKRSWLTNSFHIPVDEQVDAFTKLSFESTLAKYSTGGNISYVEIPDLTKNIYALTSVILHGYKDCLYFEVNTRTSDVCCQCGFTGQLTLKQYRWSCPLCGCKDEEMLSVVRRVCGYLGSFKVSNINRAKLEESEKRTCHL